MTRLLVPATSANLGPGFDSIGVAVSLYLTMDVLEPADAWWIDHDLGDDIPHGEDNLIIQTIQKLAPEVPAHKLAMHSDIPSARGLGSSSSAIIAGIELADRLGQKGWSEGEKINMANAIEGHPDNVAPALAGGLVIGVALEADRVLWTKHTFPHIAFVVTIPNKQLLTSQARAVLPKQLDFAQAVRANGIGNVLASKLAVGELEEAGHLMEMDLLHETYRSPLVPELKQVRQSLDGQAGVYGTYLSGAGPTIMTLAHKENAEDLADILSHDIQDAQIRVLDLDEEGARWLD